MSHLECLCRTCFSLIFCLSLDRPLSYYGTFLGVTFYRGSFDEQIFILDIHFSRFKEIFVQNYETVFETTHFLFPSIFCGFY